MSYLLFLQELRLRLGGCFDGFFAGVTKLAESPIPFVILAYIYWCCDKRLGRLMALQTGLACAIGQALKGLCRVQRPWVRDKRIHPVESALASAAGYSFPSGHTIRAGSAYLPLGLELLRKKQKQAGAAAVIVFLLIAFSRNYLGVHTIEDVAAGALICLMSYFILGSALTWAEKGGARDVIVCAGACILTFLPMLRLGCLSNSGACFGFFGGWFIERRFIRFSMPKSQASKLCRGIWGGLGILLITTAFQASLQALMPGKYAQFFACFFLAFFIMALYPAIFSCTRAKSRSLIAAVLAAAVFLLPGCIRYTRTANDWRIAVIGHRGFAGAAPENTMPAFEAALALGVDYVELDVQLSADGEIVVCHDANVQRVTGIDAALSDRTLAELKSMDFGCWFSPDYTGTQIPTLREVLERIRDSKLRVYLELKDLGGGDDAFPGAVLNLTRELGMEERCVFASFQYAYLQKIKTLDPNAKVLLNTDISEVSLPLDYPADYYGIKFSSFSSELADAIHANGAVAFVWTVDEPEQIRHAAKCGADGICSNRPDQVIAVLRGY